MKYQYDAHRVPWRIGLDACWNGSSANAADAKAFLLSNTNFFVSKSANGIGRVFDIYQVTGGVVESSDAVPNSMSAVGTAGVGAMANAGQRDRQGVPGSSLSLHPRRELHLRSRVGDDRLHLLQRDGRFAHRAHDERQLQQLLIELIAPRWRRGHRGAYV